MGVWDYKKDRNISEHFNPNYIKNSNAFLPLHPTLSLQPQGSLERQLQFKSVSNYLKCLNKSLA